MMISRGTIIKINWKPLLAIIFPWIIMLLIYHIGPLDYRNLSIGTWLFLFSILFVFIFGYKIGWTVRVSSPSRDVSFKIYKWVTILSSIGSILLLIDSLRSGFSFQLLVSDPVQGRVLQSLKLTGILTTLSYPFATLSFSAFALGLIRILHNNKNLWTYLGLASLIPFILTNALQSGRQTMFIAILMVVSSFLILSGEKKINKSFYYLFAISFVAVFIIYSVFISLKRHSEDMNVSSWLRSTEIHSKWGYPDFFLNDSQTLAFYSISYYYSHQLSGLDAIISANPSPEGFGRGVTSWYLLELSRFGIDLTYRNTAIIKALYAKGENLWGWRTGFAEIIGDFGVLGCLVFMFLMSIIAGNLVKAAKVRKLAVDYLAAIWVITSFIFSIQFFPGGGVFSMNLLLVIFLKLLGTNSVLRG